MKAASRCTALLLSSLPALSGCGGETQSAPPDAATPIGTINAEFLLPSGSASSASYTLTGPRFSTGSTLDFQGAQAVGFLINDVPAGSYTLAFTAADADGGESCMGSTPITVSAGKTAMVNLSATCIGAPYVPTGFGTIDAWASLPQATTLTDATCDLLGPAGVEVAGKMVMLMGDTGIHFQLMHVPAGTGQVLTVNATTSTGLKCTQSTGVDVVANQTAEAMLPLVCR